MKTRRCRLPVFRELPESILMMPRTELAACVESILEEEGLIESRAGAKSYVRVSAGTVETVRRELLLREVKGTVYTLKEMGLSREEALAYVRDFWDEPAEQEESHD